MKLKDSLLGVIYASLAAFCNASIGLFTNLGISDHLLSTEMAFYRCLVAFLIISLVLLIKTPRKIISFDSFIKIAISSFFGIFVLYFFEMASYNYLPVANVVFLLMGSSAIITFI